MDFYRHRLAHAHWTWMEPKFCRFLHPLRRKDRSSGRAEKHRARALERREISEQIA